MPAKKEHLSTPGQRALKISAALIGGYFLAISLQMMIGVLIPFRTEVILTGAFSVFMLWVFFMIVAFLFRNGWLVWSIYLLSTGICGAVIYLLK